MLNSEAVEWLNYLVKIDELKAGEKPAPKPAIAFEASDPGAIGNSIKIEFNNFISDPTAPLDKNKATFDAVVKYEKIYTLNAVCNF